MPDVKVHELSMEPLEFYVDAVAPGRDAFAQDIIGAVKATWGIQGSTPKDRLATAGTLTFELDNSDQNVSHTQGLYTPGHPNALSNWGIGRRIQLGVRHPSYVDRVLWYGVVESVRSGVGARGRRTAKVTCVDWLDEAARARLSGLAVQTDVQSDALFSTLVAAVEKAPPGGTRVGSGSDIYPFALDSARDEGAKVASEFAKLAVSEFGQIFVEAGVAVFEGRRVRGGEGIVRLVLDEDNTLQVTYGSHSRDDVLNRVQVSVHPRRVDAAATSVLFSVLFTLGNAQRIERVTSITINCPYKDPAQLSQRVGGKDMVVPAATTDYLFNTAQDGSGTDITAQLSVAYEGGTAGGNAATVVVTNNGPLDGYLTKLQLRGRGVYDFEPVVCDERDAASVASYGENAYAFDMPYQASPQNGIDTAQYILNLNKDPSTRVTAVSFLANWDSVTRDALFNLRISDRVSLTFPELALDGAQFFVNGIALECSLAGLCKVTLQTAPCGAQEFWLLGIDGRTELDETTVLGFGLFVPGWILDSSTLGTNTFLG